MATERITITVTANGTTTVVRELDSIGGAGRRASSSIDFLKSAVLGLGAALAAGALIQYADAATRVTNTLKLAGLAGEALTQTQDRLYAAAIANGQETESLSAIYQKLATVQKQLGTNGEEITTVTEGIAAAMRQSTSGTAAQAGALQQLSQLFGGTMVQAQEFNSLVDGAYPLLLAAAQGSTRWAGDVSKLRTDVKNSSVTVKEFFDALKIGLPAIAAQSQSMALTIGQSFVSLQQSFQQWIGESPQANQAISAISRAVLFLAANMNTIAPIVASFGLALAVAFAGGQVISMVTNLANIAIGLARIAASTALALPGIIATSVAWVAANAAFIASVAVGAALGAAIAYIVDQLFNGGKGWESFQAASTAAISTIKSTFDTVLSFMGTNANIQIQGDQAANALKTSGQTTAQTIKSSMDASGRTFTTSVTAGATQAKPIIQAGLTEGAKEAASAISDSIKEISTQLQDAIDTSFTPAIDDLTSGFNTAFETPAVKLVTDLTTWSTTLNTGLAATFATATQTLTQNLSQTFQTFIQQATQWGNGFVSAFMNAAQNAANALRSASAAAAPGPSAGSAAFAGGGQFRVGGSGGTDSQKVAFRATPNERVTIETPKQQRQSDAVLKQQQSQGQGGNTAVTNVFDPQGMVDAMASKAGHRQLVNMVKANRSQIAAVLGVA